AKAKEGPPADAKGGDEEEDHKQPKVPTEAGLNRFVWNMSWPGAKEIPGMVLWTGDPVEPVAVPGRYQVRLTAAGQTLTEPFEIRKDPRSASTQEDLEAQFRFLSETRAKLDEMHDAVRRIRDVRAQLT